jgi:hypothetical protein
MPSARDERFRVLLLTEARLVLGRKSSRRSAATDAARRCVAAASSSGQHVLEVVSVEAEADVIHGAHEDDSDSVDPGDSGSAEGA